MFPFKSKINELPIISEHLSPKNIILAAREISKSYNHQNITRAMKPL